MTDPIAELASPHGAPHIVAINNSLLPFDPAAANPLGLLHRAIITNPDPSASRVINSLGLTPDGPALPSSALEHFLSRDDLD